jgi:hypothetical protein
MAHWLELEAVTVQAGGRWVTLESARPSARAMNREFAHRGWDAHQG